MKEVIFHFFPSVRFLGLSLKILFHKNKEIKRMLSKKMTFSLMSLITIIALSFSVSPAMADPKADHPSALAHGDLAEGHAHFSTTLSYDEAENVDGRQVDVTIEFGKVVSEAAVQAETDHGHGCTGRFFINRLYSSYGKSVVVSMVVPMLPEKGL